MSICSTKGDITRNKGEHIFNEKVEPHSLNPVVLKYMLNRTEIVDYLSLVKCPLILLPLFLEEKKNASSEGRHYEAVQ